MASIYPNETFLTPVTTVIVGGVADASWRDTLAAGTGFLGSAWQVRLKNRGAAPLTFKLVGVSDVPDGGGVLEPGVYEDVAMTHITDVLITTAGTTLELREWPEAARR